MNLHPDLESRILATPGVRVNGKAWSPTLAVTEKDFQSAVEKEAKKNGWLFYHTRDSRKSAAGFPDLVLLRGTTLIVAELKVGDNQPDAAQLEWIEAFRRAGITTYVWRPADWPEIMRVLA